MLRLCAARCNCLVVFISIFNFHYVLCRGEVIETCICVSSESVGVQIVWWYEMTLLSFLLIVVDEFQLVEVSWVGFIVTFDTSIRPVQTTQPSYLIAWLILMKLNIITTTDDTWKLLAYAETKASESKSLLMPFSHKMWHSIALSSLIGKKQCHSTIATKDRWELFHCHTSPMEPVASWPREGVVMVFIQKTS